jgi:peroxiredoxin
MKKIILLGITLIMITAVFAGCTDDGNGNGNGGEELEPAPDFTLTDIDGNEFSLSDFRGKVVILDFMATWCNPCEKSMAFLKQVFNDYSSSQLQIITIDVDESENETLLRDFKDQHGDDWIYAIDTTNEVDESYKVLTGGPGVPVMVIVNQDGDIALRHLGWKTADNPEQIISDKLEELL